MNINNHAPFPWKCEVLGKDYNCVVVKDNNGLPIASFYHEKGNLESMYANAEIMTAAPVMLEALRKIAGMDAGLQTEDEETTYECNQCNNMIWIANAALKKCGVEQ